MCARKTVMLLLLVAVCASGLARVAAAQVQIPAGDSLAMIRAKLAPSLARYVARLDTMETALHRDSGTVRADSLFVQWHDSLVTTLRVLEKTFNDAAFQIAVWPDGAIGSRARGFREATSQANGRADSLVGWVNARGIWLLRGEGDAYPQVSDATLLRRMGKFLTAPMREYIGLAVLEQSQPSAADGGIMISWDDLSERLAIADLLLARNPNHAAHSQLRSRYLWSLRFYMAGGDNSPVFQRGSGAIESDVRRSYERYVAKYSSTASGTVIAKYLEILKAGGYRQTPASVAHLREVESALHAAMRMAP